MVLLALPSCRAGNTTSASETPSPTLSSASSAAPATNSATTVPPTAGRSSVSQSTGPSGLATYLSGHECSLISSSEVASIIGGPVAAGHITANGVTCKYQNLHITVLMMVHPLPRSADAKTLFNVMTTAQKNPLPVPGIGDEAKVYQYDYYEHIAAATVMWYRGNILGNVDVIMDSQIPASPDQAIALARIVDGRL